MLYSRLVTHTRYKQYSLNYILYMVYLILEKLSDVLPNPTLEVHMFKWFIAHTECDMVQVRLSLGLILDIKIMIIQE